LNTNFASLLFIVFVLNYSLVNSQEWKSLKSYQKETGNIDLSEGNWLKKDRKKQTDTWVQANKYNLTMENGNQKYSTICQIRDFYLFFDEERKEQGHEMKWIGICAIVTGQLSKIDNGFIRTCIVRNKEVVQFANEGSQKVFACGFSELGKVYYSNYILKGEDAIDWDKKYGLSEQCEMLDSLYINLSLKALGKLERMVKGKGIYNLGVPEALKFEGNLDDCKSRYNHGMNKLIPYYEEKQ
jgi:hypothetical protein